MSAIKTAWLYDRTAQTAHFCAINEDGRRRQSAAICGTVSGSTFWEAARPDAPRCTTCFNMEKSGKEIVFVMPGSGRRVVVREAQR